MQRYLVVVQLICFLTFSVKLFSQNFNGYLNNNFSGVNGIDLQPASIADSRYRFDLVFFGGNAVVSNNYIGINRRFFKNIRTGEDTGKDFNSAYLAAKSNSRPKSLHANLDLLLPSFMITLSPKDAIAFTWKYRNYAQIDQVQPELANLIYNDLNAPIHHQKRLNNDHLSIQMMGWTESGLSYARIIKNDSENFLKAGARVKLLKGSFAGHLYAENLEYSFTNDHTLSIYNSQFHYGLSDNLNIIDSINNPLRDIKRATSKTSVGLDLGIVYEFRPDHKNFTYEMDGQKGLVRRDQNKYKARIGFSILDIGRIKYQRLSATSGFRADIRNWDLDSFNIKGIESFNDTVSNRFETTQGDPFFSMNLPTAISLQVDYYLGKDFYLNFTPYVAFKFKNNKDKIHGLTTYMLTPRWEHNTISAAIPLSIYHGRLNIGLATQIGPLVIATSDIMPLLGKKNLMGANIHVALKMPIRYKMPKDKDGDKVSDEKDHCILLAGTWETRGCPDTDGDGILDIRDKCPDIAGIKENNGCPPSVAKMHLLNMAKDTIQTTSEKDSNDLFIFREVTLDRDYLFYLDDEDSALENILKVHIVNEDNDTVITAIKDKDGNFVFDYDYLPGKNDVLKQLENKDTELKLHLVTKQGKIIKTSTVNKNEYFVFEELPIDSNNLFLLEGKGSENIDTLNNIILRNGNKDRQIQAYKEKKVDKYFNYRYLPEIETKYISSDKVVSSFNNENISGIPEDNSIYFNPGNEAITSESKIILDNFVRILKSNPSWKIRISGHADKQGDFSDNYLLSFKRSEAVGKHLINRGIARSRIHIWFYGDTKPVGTNNTYQGRHRNRRVELKILTD